jgi:ABC-type multidrug transport system fused ATPase/permease subunit
VILDEATASVDRETERRLQKAQEELIAGRTAVIVAHRLSTIERCDRIVLMHDGRVLEEGTHAELMGHNGRYAALVELQRSTI